MSADLLDLGRNPIRPDAPSGAPGRDEPEFDALQLEIRKLELPDQPTVNWDLAVRSASALLGTTSKDLLVAAYLAVALLERDGYPALVTGLTILRDLVTGFWDSLFPEAKRMRGRAAAFEWLAERGAVAIRRRGRAGMTPELMQSLRERVEEIENLLAPRMDGGGSLLGELRIALNELPVEEEAPAMSAAPAGATPGSSAPAATSAVPSSLSTSSDLETTVNEAKRLLRMAADYMRTADAKDPLAYRLPRFAAWLTLKQLPPAVDGKTQIPAPQPPDLLDRLNGMMANGQYAGLLQETEGRIATSVLWLDTHRLAAQALERMGSEYQSCADAIGAEAGSLLKRLPGLVDLRFVNDQPLANPDTKTWIQQRVLAAAGDGAAPAPARVGGDEEDARFAEVRAEATALARQKKLAEAVGLLERESARSGGLRDRVRWKLEVARLCRENDHNETALAQLEGLDEEMRDARIEAWDPAACVEVLRNLLACRQRSQAAKTPEEIQRSRELMGRLCRLDVIAALELNGKR